MEDKMGEVVPYRKRRPVPERKITISVLRWPLTVGLHLDPINVDFMYPGYSVHDTPETASRFRRNLLAALWNSPDDFNIDRLASQLEESRVGFYSVSVGHDVYYRIRNTEGMWCTYALSRRNSECADVKPTHLLPINAVYKQI
ncbi:MAG: hypothetical protein ACREGH_02655 [Minisyncoccia bacterium]